MSNERLNAPERLNGGAKVHGIASTIGNYDLLFTVWSERNQCAAADLVPSESGRPIYGVLYEIPDDLVERKAAKAKGCKSLDVIEGEGKNYQRVQINVTKSDGESVSATTYVVREKDFVLQTSNNYARHIVEGLNEHPIPVEYRDYVIGQIEKNNPSLQGVFRTGG